MAADITQSGRAKKSVADSVRQCVTIGMAFRSHFKRNFDAAENQLSAADKPMHIIPETDAVSTL